MTLAYNHSDKLLTTGILSETITGYLTAAFVINFGLIELFSTSVLVAAYPLLARYYDEGRNPLFGFMIEKLALYMVLVGLPMALSISILADKIIVPLLGEAYEPSAGILRLLIWFTAITIFGNVFTKGMLIQNRQRRLLLDSRGQPGAQHRVDSPPAIQLGRPPWRRCRVYRRGDPRCRPAAAQLPRAGLAAETYRQQRHASIVYRRSDRAGDAGSARAVYRSAFVRRSRASISAASSLVRVLSSEDWDLIYRLVSTLPGAALLLRFWKRDVELSW